MKKFFLWALFAALSGHLLVAQSAKIHPPAEGPEPTPEQLRLRPWPGKVAVPAASNPFGVPAPSYKPLAPLTLAPAAAEDIHTVRGENGLPIFFQGKTAASYSADADEAPGQHAVAYFASLKPAGIMQAADEFVAKKAENDEQGMVHVRLEQVYQGVPVYGGEVIAHAKNGVFELVNGRYYPTPELISVTPSVSADEAVQKVVEQIGPTRVKTSWTDAERQMVGGAEKTTELVVYHPGRDINAERLAWHIVIYPNLLHREVYFVDAQNGTILHHFDNTCEFLPEHGSYVTPLPAAPAGAFTTGGPVIATGLDLMNQNRSFGAWMDGSTIYLEDAGRPMFNSNASTMPGDPVGVIVTLDALNKSPEVPQTFDYTLVTSGTTTFNNKNAVSAHWNAIQSYEYYRTTHTRNSIDGVGGNIISFFNVSNANGTSMENAYWNGAAMWYGNGGTSFYQLARGLDVGGHEMTHGVIEKTGNMEYQDESGALNESFADVFAVCIDRGDWLIGEDVVKSGTNLRDMQEPHNGSPAQPNHVNEKYTGSQDNGGVHINSGIPNKAFYLFASNAAVGLAKAEKVYYKALKDYLVKSSQFIDCRLAVIQAANDLYGSAVATAAGDAFTAVGIVGNQGGDYLGELAVNPGDDLIVCATEDLQNVDLALGNGNVLGTMYQMGIASRPSVSDNGQQVVFVDADGYIIGVDLSYNGGTINSQWYELSQTPDWRSAAISKDGQYVAALSKVKNNRIYIFDLFDPFTPYTYFLYNPTYSQTPQTTGEVQYADVLEFDYSGEFLMYDAYNQLTNGQGDDVSYWDIGFLQYRANGNFTDGATAFISKLFSGLPEKTGVGNPTLAKNSPYVIAFDVIDGLNNRNDIFGANVETGDVGALVTNNGALGWPCYSRLDNAVIFDRPGTTSTSVYGRNLAADKITGVGGASVLIPNRNWGVWFSNGSRSLMVDAAEPAAAQLGLSVAPNPATDAIRLSFTAPQAGPARVIVSDMLGRTVLNRTWTIPEGENQLELNLQGLPAGAYALRLLAAGGSAAMKVVKQ